MNDTLTPDEAARLLKRASSYEEALEQRTEGITLMLWGLVVAAIFTTYAFAATLSGGGWWMAGLWIPWVAAGYLMTYALWRSAALERPALESLPQRSILLRWLGLTALITLAMFVVDAEGPSEPLLVVGLFWLALAVFNPFCGTRVGRLLTGAAGAVLAGTAGVLLAMDAPVELAGTLAVVLSGVVPVALGFYQTTRG